VERGIVLSRGEYLDETELSLLPPGQGGTGALPSAGEMAAASQASPGATNSSGTPFTRKPKEVPFAGGPAAPGTGAPSLETVERETILRTLESAGGNKSEAARRLGITRRTLHQKLRKYGMM
jgi:two-component system response regulator HydG